MNLIEPSIEEASEMNDCLLCGHPQRGHVSDGCHGPGSQFSACGCSWVVPEPLAADAGAQEHCARSDWWDEQARSSWELALHARGELDRWYGLMRFHRQARQGEIAHRRHAESLTRPSSLDVSLATERPPSAPAAPALTESATPFARRLELATLA